MPAIRLYVTGRVQGVFYRATAAEKAKEFGIRGWVQNTQDGAVEAHAEGERKAINSFAAWCKEGPPSARVDIVDIEEVSEEGHTSFEIRR